MTSHTGDLASDDLRSDDFRSQIAREVWLLGERRGWIALTREAALPIELAYVASKGYIENWPDNYGNDSRVVVIIEQNPQLLVKGMRSLANALNRAIGPQGVAFLNRALGTDVVHRLKNAWRADRSIFRPAIEKGWADLMPYFNAFEICREAVDAPPIPVKALPSAAQASVELLVDLFSDARTTSTTSGGHEAKSAINADQSPPTQASIVRAPSSIVVEMLNSLDSPLLMKVRGAREVLGVSSDAVSQAANSAVELIDHTLRVFDDETVIRWIESNIPSELTRLTYVEQPSEIVHPTKRAQALHLLFGGREIEDEDFETAMRVVADVLTKTRRQLERLKHGEAEPNEKSHVEVLLNQVEAAMIILLGVVQLSPDSHRSVVHSNLSIVR